jgi:hypothetical protein
MGSDLQSPLSGHVTSRFGGAKKHRSKIFIGLGLIAVVPFVLSTFAASVTVGTGSLEFGQGSQQAISCDDTVFIALGEEWHASPVAGDASAGFFRVRTATISNLNLTSCAGKKIRLRLIDGSGGEIPIAPGGATVFEVSLPKTVPTQNSSDAVALGFADLLPVGTALGVPSLAQVSLNVSGISVYDGTPLSQSNGDLTFYLDPSASTINIDGQSVHRMTVETVNNPN